MKRDCKRVSVKTKKGGSVVIDPKKKGQDQENNKKPEKGTEK